MAETDSWLRAEIGGTKRASVITKPEVLVVLLKNAKRPLVVIGHEALSAGPEGETMIGFIGYLQRYLRIPVLSTAHTAGELISRGIKPAASMAAMEIADRLRSPAWRGLDGKGQYDLVLITGLPYSLGWLVLSGLRLGSPAVKVVSLDRKYQPHATWAFGNIGVASWQSQIETVTDGLKKQTQKGETKHV